MIPFFLLLALQEERAFRDPVCGARFTVPASFTLRTERFSFDWADTRCEFESPDGAVRGLLYASNAGWNVRDLAAWRENSLRATKGTDELKVTKSGSPSRARGEWMSREYRLVYHGSPFRYVDLYFARGRHNVQLVTWCREPDWEAGAPAMRRIADSLVFAGAWSCPRCGAEGLSDPFVCGRCGSVGLPPHEELAKIARKHEIQIVTNAGPIYPVKCASGNVITGARATDRELVAYCEKLARELAKYPEPALRRIGVERLVLASNVRMNGNKVGSVADAERDTIHFEVRDGAEIGLFFEETVHHELFHFLDRRDDGSSTADPEWEKLNPPGFRYDPTITPSGRFEDDLQGFLNTYSQTAVGEDKAEIFGQSMVRSRALAARAAKDAVIARKISRMRELVREFEPALDEGFWKRVER